MEVFSRDSEVGEGVVGIVLSAPSTPGGGYQAGNERVSWEQTYTCVGVSQPEGILNGIKVVFLSPPEMVNVVQEKRMPGENRKGKKGR